MKIFAAAGVFTLVLSFALPAWCAQDSVTLGTDRHAQAGIGCQACHADPAKPSAPEMTVCTGCHNADQLVDKTSKVKPANPHVSPHYGKDLDCCSCHHMHSASENFCAQCHSFDWKVP